MLMACYLPAVSQVLSLRGPAFVVNISSLGASGLFCRNNRGSLNIRVVLLEALDAPPSLSG